MTSHVLGRLCHWYVVCPVHGWTDPCRNGARLTRTVESRAGGVDAAAPAAGGVVDAEEMDGRAA